MIASDKNQCNDSYVITAADNTPELIATRGNSNCELVAIALAAWECNSDMTKSID